MWLLPMMTLVTLEKTSGGGLGVSCPSNSMAVSGRVVSSPYFLMVRMKAGWRTGLILDLG